MYSDNDYSNILRAFFQSDSPLFHIKGIISFDEFYEEAQKLHMPFPQIRELAYYLFKHRHLVYYAEKYVLPLTKQILRDNDGDYILFLFRMPSLVKRYPFLEPLFSRMLMVPPAQPGESEFCAEYAYAGNIVTQKRLIQLNSFRVILLAIEISESHNLPADECVSIALCRLTELLSDPPSYMASITARRLQELVKQGILLSVQPQWANEHFAKVVQKRSNRRHGISFIRCCDYFFDHDGDYFEEELVEYCAEDLGISKNIVSDALEGYRVLTQDSIDINDVDSYAVKRANMAITPYLEQLRDATPDLTLINDERKKIVDAMNDLKDREKQVLIEINGLVDGLPKHYWDVTGVFDCSRERIRQIEAKALRILRNPVRSKKIKDYY